MTRNPRGGYRGRGRGWGAASFFLLLILFSTKQWSEEKCEIRRGEKQRARAERTGRVYQGEEDESKEPELTVREPQCRGEGRLQEREGLGGDREERTHPNP